MNQKTTAHTTISGAILAAIAAMPMFAASARAQTPVPNGGHAIDANNMVGGNGRNDQNSRPMSNQVTGNQIATGNVTNGMAFQGANFRGLNIGTGLTDPTAFRGILPGAAIEQYIANSGGMPTNSNPLASSQGRTARPFYGNITTAGQVPSDYVQAPGGGGYVPAATLVTPSIDTRIGSQNANGGIPLPKPGDLLLPGPVDMSASQNFSPASLSASQLYGGSYLSPGQQLLMRNYSDAMNSIPGQWSSSQSLDAFQVMQFRREMNQNQVQNQIVPNDMTQPNSPASSSNTGQQPSGSMTPSPNGQSQQNSQQPNTLQPGQVAPMDNQFQPKNLTPAAGDFSTGQSLSTVAGPQSVPSPSQQSSQYAQMEQRLKDFQAMHPDSPDDADQTFLNQLQSQRNMLNPQGGQNPPTDLPQANSAAGGAALPPVQIGSLAKGVASKGLADLLTKAEDATKAGKYDQAIGIYNSAIEVAPNNGLILIGRAHAEMGGSYYRQADSDIRSAFHREPSLLMAQYDLQSQVGDDRLTAIIAELKQIATNSPDSSTPVFLLAYIAYNTHHEDKAGQWLNVAHQRDPQDEVIPEINKHWSLTSSPTTKP